MRRLIFAAVTAALASGGCATVKPVPAPAPLEVPVPPPRVIVPPAEPESTPPQAPAPETKSTSKKPAPKTVVPRPEPKAEPVRPADPSVPVPPPPTATLQQALPGTPAEVEGQVRKQLDQARADLKRVRVKNLTADEKLQYDTAHRFITQAEQALADGNLMLASKVAEKAAGLAASLPVR